MRPERLPGRDPAGALQEAAAVIQGGASPEQFRESIDAGYRQLGNRAFMRWVGLLHAAGHGGQAQADIMQGRQDPAGSAPLQCMPKKHRKKERAMKLTPETLHEGEPETGAATLEMTAEPATGTGPEPVDTSQQPEPGEAAAAAAKKKKKKKPRVQVALNTLRAGNQDEEGVEAFRRYMEAEIGDTALLNTLVERIKRAQDLGGRQQPALDAVTSRLRTLGPGTGACAPRAAGAGQEEVAQSAASEPVNLILNPRQYRFIDSCRHGKVRKLRQLLGLRLLDVNLSTCSGTPLCIAAMNGHTGIVRELLSEPNIDVNLGQWGGATPLFLAAQYGYEDIVRLLLAEDGSDPNLGMHCLKTTPLITAANQGRDAVVKLLVADHRVRINLRQADGATALFAATEGCFSGIVEVLVEHGTDVNLTLFDGTPPLCVAADKGDIESLKHLLGAPGIQVDQRSGQQRTALFYAAESGHKEVVELLLEHGADPNVAHKTRVAPLHLACLHGHTDIVVLLLDAGADMDARTEDDYTCYQVAQFSGNESTMRLIQERLRDREVRQSRTKESIPSLKHAEPGETVPLPEADIIAGVRAEPLPDKGVEGGPEPAVTDQHDAAAAPSTEAAFGGRLLVKAARSPLEQAKAEFIDMVLEKLRHDWLDPLDGIRLLEQVNSTADVEGLCTIFNRLAGIERKKYRSGRRRIWRGFQPAEGPPAYAEPSGYALGEKQELDADTVEDEIRKYLAPAHHKFLSQAVNDMEFGRGKPTPGYPGVLHASAGITGAGSCSVFFSPGDEAEPVRIVGIGHHLDRRTYRLNYAAGGLQGLRTMRLC